MKHLSIIMATIFPLKLGRIIDKSSALQTNPLEQYLLLARKETGAAAVELIKQVLEAPSVYVFAELLDIPNIIQVKRFFCC